MEERSYTQIKNLDSSSLINDDHPSPFTFFTGFIANKHNGGLSGCLHFFFLCWFSWLGRNVVGTYCLALDRIAGSATEFRIFGRLVHPRVLQIHELSHRYQRNGVDIPVNTLPKNSRGDCGTI